MSGTTVLVRLAARRDRLIIPIWIYALAASVVGTAVSYGRLYPTEGSRLDFAAGLRANPSVLAVYGRLGDPTTIGGLTAWRLLAIGSVLVGVFSVLLVVRHTRADEEAGRLELVRAQPIPRWPPVLAALLLAAATNLVIAAVAAAGLVVLGAAAAGSIAFGLGWLLVGLVFAGVAACVAQVVETSRAANGASLAVLGLAYLLRAAGDSSTSAWLSWTSPIGWAQQLRPFGAERWWVLVLPLVVFLLLAGTGLMLADRRDLGSGLLGARPGPSESMRLRGPFGLVWRQQRGMFAGWVGGLVIYGAVLGSLVRGVEGLVGNNDRAQRVIADLGGPGGLADAFLATVFGVVAILAAAYAVQSVVRLRQEEVAGRAELLLGAAPGRTRWAGAYAAVALGGVAAIMLATGFAAGLADGWRSHDVGRRLAVDTAAAAVHVPAACVVGGVALLIFGVAPRLMVGAWVILMLCVLLGQFGVLFGLPQWLLDVSPFTHTPKLPGGTASPGALIVLGVTAIALGAGGLLGFRRRDVG